MGRDPAVLFFIDTWLTATKEMKADCRGWYLNLILHQYDKNGLPNDVEELANLADVRVSEYKRFEQVFEQVLKHKFILNADTGRLENEIAKEILRRREEFKDKRALAGKISYFLRYARKNLCTDENIIQFVKNKIDFNTFDIKNEQVFEQVFEQTSELYNGNGIGNGIIYNTVDTTSNTIAPEMFKIFKKHNPTYPADKTKDFSACLQIAYKIAEGKGWDKSEVLNGKKNEVMKSWEKIVLFTTTDNWFSKRALYDLSNEWQRLIQSMNGVKNGASKPEIAGSPIKKESEVDFEKYKKR